MNLTTHTPDAFIGSFAHYLKTGETDQIAQFCPDKSQLPFLSIYRNGFYKACIDALIANFAGVYKVIGDQYFKHLARAYVDEHLPTRGTLVGYGLDFPAFVHAQFATHNLPYLADIARLDYQWLATHYANHDLALSPEGLAPLIEANNGDIESLRLPLHASVTHLTLDWSVADVWSQLKQGGELGERTQLSQVPQLLVFWQQDLNVYFRPIDAAERVFLQALANEFTLGDASQAACKVDEDFDIAGTFSGLLQSGCFRQK